MEDQYHSEDDDKDVEVTPMHLDDSYDAIMNGMEILQEAEQYWENLSPIRDRRVRARKYVFGEQWDDEIDDPDNPGETITEKEYIIRQGKNPLVTNYLGPLIKNIKGQYRNNDSKPGVRARRPEDQQAADMLTNALQAAYDSNELSELDSQVFYEFLLSAMIGWKTGFQWIRHRNTEDVYCEALKMNRIFFNTDTSDIRGHDIRFIGQIIDAPIEAILQAYANDKEEREVLESWYAEAKERHQPTDLNEMGSHKEDSIDFYVPYQTTLCRLYEIWKLKNVTKVFIHDPEKADYYQHPGNDIEMIIETIKLENEIRKLKGREVLEFEVKNEDVWCYYILTPTGKVLSAGESPYEHESHPYTLRLYPLIDGDIRAFVDDVIDLQKQVNRQTILQDFLISGSAKGLLMVPEDIIPDGWTNDDYAAQHSRVGGMIVYKPKPHGQIPQEISSNSRSVTSEQMLQFALQSMKEISGITEAIQGQTPKAGTPASLYAEQANNATLATRDYFEHFTAARRDRDYKIVKIMQQFYDEQRYVAVSGTEYIETAKIYDPDVASEAQIEMVIGKSANAPVYREIRETYLMQFLQSQLIDLETYLENSSVPWSPSFISQVKQQKQAMMQQMGMAPQQMSPENQQQVLDMLPQAS